MRTLKTLAALGALLLVASSASATMSFQVHAVNPLDQDSTQSFQFDITLSAGQSLDLFGLNWTYTSGTAVGGPPTTDCLNTTQTMCSFGAPNTVAPISGNANGTNWVWDSAGVGPTGPANYTNVALFTLSGLTNGTVISLNTIEAFDGANVTITDTPVVSYTVVVPEPTTAALIGLGLAGLALAGRRKA